MATDRVYTQGRFKVVILALREQFRHVPEIIQTVIDRRRRQHKELLRSLWTIYEIEQLVLAGGFSFIVPSQARIAEVMRLVNHYYIGQLFDSLKPIGEVTDPPQVGMIENH